MRAVSKLCLGFLELSSGFPELHVKIAHYSSQILVKVKTSIGNAPISKNEMEALITNHVKEYVLNITWL